MSESEVSMGVLVEVSIESVVVLCSTTGGGTLLLPAPTSPPFGTPAFCFCAGTVLKSSCSSGVALSFRSLIASTTSS